MSNYRSKGESLLQEYGQIKSIPATLSAAWLATGLYGLGGMKAIEFVWINYTLSPAHATLGGLLVYLLAFMGSETKQFENYEPVEQLLVVAGPAVFAAEAYFPAFDDFLISLGDPLGHQIAFALTVVAWMVAVR
jgi:hypothetical protein